VEPVNNAGMTSVAGRDQPLRTWSANASPINYDPNGTAIKGGAGALSNWRSTVTKCMRKHGASHLYATELR